MGEDISTDDIKILEEKGDVEGLCKALLSDDLKIKELASRALIHVADDRALEPLISTLESVVNVRSDEGSTESIIRHYCILALKELANPAAIDVLIKASAKSDEGYFDMDVGFALQAIGEPAIAPLIEVLNGNDDRRRSTAAVILGGIGGDEVSEALFFHICDDDPSVRNAVVISLGKMKDPRSVGPLINRALNDEYVEIRKNAREALEGMGVDVPSPVEESSDLMPLDYAGGTAAHVRDLMEGEKTDKLLSSLIAIYKEDPQLLLMVVEELGVEAVLSAINPAVLERGDDYLDLVVFLGEPALDYYINALQNEDEDIRYIAANALGAIGDANAVDSLIACLEDPDPDVRNSSVCALGYIGDRKAAEPLMDLAKKEDEDFIRENIRAVLTDMLVVISPAVGEEAPSSIIGEAEDEEADRK
jgi:HEAT repeat protein